MVSCALDKNFSRQAAKDAKGKKLKIFAPLLAKRPLHEILFGFGLTRLGTMRKLSWITGCLFTICLTLGIRVLWLSYLPDNPIGPIDAEGFHLLAVNVLDGNGFAIGWETPFCPTAVRTPLYPLFIMLGYRVLGRDPARILWLQVLLEALTTALLIRTGRDIGGDRVGLWAGLLYAINGTTQRYTGYLLSETLLLPMLAAALCLTLRALRQPTRWRLAWAAMLWGLALLTKPNVQFLAIAVGMLLTLQVSVSASQRFSISVTSNPYLASSHVSRFMPHISRFLIFWGVLFVVLFPWLLRNRLVLGRWMLSSAFAENVARVSAVAVLADVNHIPADPWTETWEYLYGQIVSTAGARYAWAPASDAALGTAPLVCETQWKRQQQVAAVAQGIVWQHPRAWLATHAWGVMLSLLDPGHHLWYRVLTGRGWDTTGVVANIWVRIAWAVARQAWGDAAAAFWQERVVRLPADAAFIWWILLGGRLMAWALGWRGGRRLRHKPWWGLLLGGTLLYFVCLPGPIAYDRFYVPAVPVTVLLIASNARADK